AGDLLFGIVVADLDLHHLLLAGGELLGGGHLDLHLLGLGWLLVGNRRFVVVLEPLLEVPDALAEALADIRDPAGPEQEHHDDQDDYPMHYAEAAHDVSSCELP